MLKKNTRRPPASGPPVHAVITGLLAVGMGIEITQRDALTLVVKPAGEPALEVACRVVSKGGRHYLEGTLSRLLASPAVSAALAGRFDTRRKNFRVHQIVGVVGRGANLTGSARGLVGLHHVNLDALNNRAANLRTLTTSTHNALHRHLDALSPEGLRAYLDSIPGSANGLGDGLPESLIAAIQSDLAALETPNPTSNEQE